MMASYYVWGNLNARYRLKPCYYGHYRSLLLLAYYGERLLSFQPLLCCMPFISFSALGLVGFNQMVFAFTIGDTPKSERPMYIATYSAITGFAAFLGPIFGGKVYALITDAPMWVQIYGVSTLVGAVLLVLGLLVGRMVLGKQIRSEA